MASLTKSARQERARILRELLLRTGLKRRAHPTTDYTDALADLTSEMVVTDTNNILSVSVTDMMGNATDARHTLIAACRLIMGTLETAPGRSAKKVTLTAHLTARGFTANSIAAALGWLTEQGLITVRDGMVTDITGDRRPSKPRPQLPAELVAPRIAAPAPSTPAHAVNTRPRMDADPRMVSTAGTPDPTALGKRMRQQSQMPSASFEVGDVPAAPSTKKVEKPAASAIAATTAERVLKELESRPSGFTEEQLLYRLHTPTPRVIEALAALERAGDARHIGERWYPAEPEGED